MLLFSANPTQKNVNYTLQDVWQAFGLIETNIYSNFIHYDVRSEAKGSVFGEIPLPYKGKIVPNVG